MPLPYALLQYHPMVTALIKSVKSAKQHMTLCHCFAPNFLHFFGPLRYQDDLKTLIAAQIISQLIFVLSIRM